MRALRLLTPATLTVAVLLFPWPAVSGSRVSKTRELTGFSIEAAVEKPKGKPDLEKLEAVLDDALQKSTPAAQAMFDQFRTGEHPYRGLDLLLDLTPPPEEPKPEPKPEPVAPAKKQGKAAGKEPAAAKKKEEPKEPKKPEPGKPAKVKKPDPRQVGIALLDVDRPGREALAKIGLDLSWIRLHTRRVLTPETSARLSASFLLAQAFGGPLKELPVAEGFDQGVPCSLLTPLDRVSPLAFVTAWRLRVHLRAVAAGKEAVINDGKASDAEMERARLIAQVWAAAFDDKPYPDEIYARMAKLGGAELGELLQLMALCCREDRFPDFWAGALSALGGSSFAPGLDLLKAYVSSAYDYPLPENLIAAVREGDPRRVKRILYLLCDPNARDHEGEPALVLAVNGEQAEIVRLLVEAGANPSVAGRDGRTALELANWKRLPDLIQALSAKAEPKQK